LAPTQPWQIGGITTNRYYKQARSITSPNRSMSTTMDKENLVNQLPSSPYTPTQKVPIWIHSQTIDPPPLQVFSDSFCLTA
jgi:hypothetical protein